MQARARILVSERKLQGCDLQAPETSYIIISRKSQTENVLMDLGL